MPNDPRVKFHKGGKICRKDIEYLKKHPECYGFIKHNTAFGSGSGRGEMSSIFEDGTPPPDRPDPGGGGGGGEAPRYTPTESIPQPLKPGLNPGEITGITIGSLVGIAAAVELTRRALEEERRRRGGERQVSQDDRPLSSRQSGGNIFERQSRVRVGRAISRGMANVAQQFEMTNVPARPVQADFAPISIESSPSSSSTSTPSRSSSDFQSALSRPLSTPETEELTSLFPNRSGFKQQIEPQRTPMLEALAQAQRPLLAPPQDIEMTKLQQLLENNQIELQNPNISEARTKVLEREIRVLERKIRDSGGTVTTLEDRIRAATATPLPELPYTESLFTALTPEERLTLEKTSLFDINDPFNVADMTQEQFNAFTERNKMNIQRKPGDVSPEIDRFMFLEGAIENIELKLLNPQMPPERRQTLVAEQTKLKNTLATEQKAFNDANIRRAVEKVKLGLETSKISGRRQKTASGAAPRSISKTITPETPIANNPVNDRINAARPTQIEMTETGLRANAPLVEGGTPSTIVEVKTRGASTMEKMRTEIQKMTSRKGTPLQPKGTPLQPQETAIETAIETAPRTTPRQETAIETAPRPVEARVETYMDRDIQSTAEVSERMAAGVGIDFNEPPRPAQPQEDFGTELRDAGGLTFRDKPLDKFNNMYDLMTERWRAYYSESIPTAPEGMTEIASKKYVMEQILKEQAANGDPIRSGDTEQKVISLEEALDKVQSAYDRTDPTTTEEITTKKSLKPDRKRKLTKQTELLATEEQRLRPTAFAGETQARVRARQSTAETSTQARPPTPPRARPTSQQSLEEISARAATPEIAARRRLGVPELTPPPTAAPEERASFAERRAFFEETSKVKPPTGEPAPSAPPSAPESEIQTPREGAITERTPAERAAFAEEVRLGMNKKIPARQKAKINMGKTSKITRNPLDIFVSPQYRNAPNVEIHPGAKNLRGALSELGARVPRLIPTREVLLSAGGSFAAEGGGMVAGFYAGSAAGQEMSKYFATHPPKNRGEEYGQALATSMVALGVGNLTAKVVTYVIKQGARAAMGASISGSISSAGVAGASAILEAAIFATVATTTQFYTTKALEDAGYNHSTSRGLGSAAATEALLGLEFVSFMAKGGPLNPLAIGSFVASELFILGFGIWSFFEETEEGRKEDEAEQTNREAEEARIAEARVERQIAVDKINKTNYLRAGFMVALETHDYDFDKVYAELSDADKIAMGISTPESKASFQRQVESAFDPFNAFQESSPGVSAPEVLSPIEQQRRDVFNSYINWYLGELRGETQPPFDFNDPKVKELDEYSGGTWKSAAGVTATTNHMQSERVNPLIVNAQTEIVDAFHNERRTIEEMDPETVRFATLDPNFRNVYEAYIVSEAQAQILIEFNRTQYTYNDVDPKLLAIADRDPTFRSTADAYYQVLANQARDLNLSISEVARLNSLMETEQTVEIGKLNDARNKIIEKNMADNQASIDAYNANIIREINVYGANFEAIIRNINDQALLSGHTFMYATTKADLYRQLHMEMPELELVDPVDEIDKPDAPWHPGKGRKVGDTAIYNYRYNLTDEQNQELEDMIVRGEITRADAERQAAFIRERDRPLFTETDQERADALGMSIDDYHAQFGITIDVFDMSIEDYTSDKNRPPENGRIRMLDGSIKTYRNGVLIDTTPPTIIETPIPTYNPALPQQPDGEVKMPDGSVRTYKDGLVVSVLYNSSTPSMERLSPDQINAKEKPPTQPGTGTGTITYEQLQQQYPETYKNLLRKYGDDPTGPAQIEATLRKAYAAGFNETTGETTSGLTPGGEPVEPTTQIPQILFSGERTMPDGVIRLYSNGKILGFEYPPNYPADKKIKSNAELTKLNRQEGLYYVDDPNPPAQVISTDPATLKQGNVKMPDGTVRTYQNGLVIFINYPVGANTSQKTLQEINEEEGIRDATYTPTATTPVTPVAPTASLKQGLVKMPDGEKRIYIDGLVVSVSYPEGKTGKTINEINTSEGVQTGTTPSPAPAVPNPAVPNPAVPNPAVPNPTAQSLNLTVAPMAAPATTSMPETTTAV